MIIQTIIVTCLIVMVYCGMMLYRNHCVFQYRVKKIYENMNEYDRLPSYDTMMRKFWVWDFDKFLD
jgi:hypothetical protein